MEKTEDGSGKQIANLIMNDLKGLLKKHKLTIEQCPIEPEVIGFFGRAIASGSLDKKQVKTLMTKFFEENLENGKAKENSNDDDNYSDNNGN